jgi:hypothetical protein
MRTFTLHLPRDTEPGDPAALAEAELVKDGFVWGAFLFSFLWFFCHRLWLAGLVVLAGVVCLSVALTVIGAEGPTTSAVLFLFAVLVGLEANSLRRWTYARHGRPAIDAISADSEEEAALKAFGRAIEGRQRHAAMPAPGRGGPVGLQSRSDSDVVLGLFPSPEPRR